MGHICAELSKRGAIVAKGKKAKRINDLEEILNNRGGDSAEVITPFALPMFADPAKKRKRNDDDSKVPDGGGRTSHLIGSQNSASSNFTQAVCEGLIKQKRLATGDNRDPREELFQYIDKNPSGANTGFDAAYAKSDPKKLIAKKTQEQE